jgi:AcrR family transcriptional regulator
MANTNDHEAMRADAQQNRTRILAVAHDALAQSADASLNSIAKAAGVGAGTLYRHFPTREALVLAVYRYDVDQLVDSVPSLLAAQPPLDALRTWIERLALCVQIKHGLGDALDAATKNEIVRDTYQPVIDAIAELLHACEDVGVVREGVDADDVLLLAGSLWRIEPGPRAEARAGRVLDLLIDGLRPQPRSTTHVAD